MAVQREFVKKPLLPTKYTHYVNYPNRVYYLLL